MYGPMTVLYDCIPGVACIGDIELAHQEDGYEGSTASRDVVALLLTSNLFILRYNTHIEHTLITCHCSSTCSNQT